MDQKQTVIEWYKNAGETPLESLERLRVAHQLSPDEKLSYAGRLDPLAEGLMLVLVGEENKNREAYLGLDKVYELKILFRVGTDTQDLMGLITDIDEVSPDLKSRVEAKLPSYVGIFTQPYPAFSSHHVQGKALFTWAKEGRLHEIEIPTKEVEIYSIENQGWSEISSEELIIYLHAVIGKVKGDFRQEEILSGWDQYLATVPHSMYAILSLKVSCASGTYMRALAERIGKDVALPALAMHIRRSKVGEHTLT